MTPSSDAQLTDALTALTLEEKVQLLTGRDFWTTWPIEKIGLRRILVSDGPSGVRGEVWDERDPSLNLPSATALASSWDPDIARRYGAAAAVEAVKAHHLQRVLNDRAFGGYLIWRQMPVFIDGRAELYGEKFTMAYYNALELKNVGQFLALLKDNDIDGLMLQPGTPALGLLEHLGAWRRVYADDVAILYARADR